MTLFKDRFHLISRYLKFCPSNLVIVSLQIDPKKAVPKGPGQSMILKQMVSPFVPSSRPGVYLCIFWSGTLYKLFYKEKAMDLFKVAFI